MRCGERAVSVEGRVDQPHVVHADAAAGRRKSRCRTSKSTWPPKSISTESTLPTIKLTVSVGKSGHETAEMGFRHP